MGGAVRLNGAAVVALGLVLGAPGPARAQGRSDRPPVGLTREDWRQIRTALGPAFTHEAELLPRGDPLGKPGARFGNSVSLSGDTFVVGAPFEVVPPSGAFGTAHVFVRTGTTWVEQQKLYSPDPGVGNDEFGTSVSISGDTLVVGADRADTPSGADAGAAYVFVRSGATWTLQQKLTASDGHVDARFGYSVSVSGDSAVVGGPFGNGFAVGAYVFVRSGSVWTEQQKLQPLDLGLGDQFGSAVSIAGDTAVVGSPLHDPGPMDAGAAYVFVRSGTTWSQQQKLTAPDAGTNDEFGHAVVVSADTVLCGAPLYDLPNMAAVGSAYVFVRTGTVWSLQQKLLASDGLANAQLGTSVSIDGDTAVVGAYLDDAPFQDTGSAYVFVRSGAAWAEQQKLVPADGGVTEKFGFAVAVQGDTAVVGTLDDVLAGQAAGSVFVFVRAGATWSEQQQFGLLDGSFDEFGTSVSVSGSTAVVGAPGDTTPSGPGAGSAYVFVRSGATWTEQQKLVASDGHTGDQFGCSVAISGDIVVIGACDTDVGGNNAGSAYVFTRTGTVWTQQQKVVASDPEDAAQFGNAVALSVAGDTLAVASAFKDEFPATFVGAVYVFTRSGPTWTQQQKLLASDGGTTDFFGKSVSLSGETLLVGAYGAGVGGAAYVFVRSGTVWTEQQKLVASDAAPGDGFGFSVSVSGDTALVGAIFDDTAAGADAGSAYVFVRSGVTWTEQQKLLPSDGAANDHFGNSIAAQGDTAIVAAVGDDSPGFGFLGSAYVFVRSGVAWTEQQKLLPPVPQPGASFGSALSFSLGTLVVGASLANTIGSDSGAAEVFRDSSPYADLAVAKTDGQSTAVPGEPLVYTVAVSNGGPEMVAAATVTDVLPPALLGPTWTCAPSPGSSCTASGSGSINDTVDLPVGGTVTYTVTGVVDPAATGSLANTAAVVAPSGTIDPEVVNNSATDVDTLTPEGDLVLTKTDSADPVMPGGSLTYTLNATNDGPSDATLVTLVDTLPPGVTFVSSSPGPPACTNAGGTVTCDVGAFPAGAATVVTIDVTVNATAGILVNTATISGNETDPDPEDNVASEGTAVGPRDGELAHGTDLFTDLAAQPGPVADEDVYRINQKPLSSYEVLMDGVSGDIGSATGSVLERIAPDGTTILQASDAVGAGFNRSLRWMNTTAVEVEGEAVRVRSVGCTTECGTDDVYRIRAYETTYRVPRFNNSGTQITVLVLQSLANDAINGEIYFRSTAGVLVATEPFALNPRATLVLNTSTIPGANGVSGTITIAHDGRYGDLSGKTVALEPATGFSFDSALEPRLK